MRTCSRPGCVGRAVAQLRYAYAASVAEIGPLAAEPVPHTYALCQDHVDKLTVPKGWRLERRGLPRPTLSPSQVTDLAAAVRRAGGVDDDGVPRGTEPTLSGRDNVVLLAQRAHLRVVADAAQCAAPASRRVAG